MSWKLNKQEGQLTFVNGKRVNLMDNMYDFERTIEHQFDSFCKTVLRNQARNLYDENKRRNKILVSLELLTQSELCQLAICDIYESKYIHISVFDYDLPIEDVLIAQAIESLSKRKILFYYHSFSI